MLTQALVTHVALVVDSSSSIAQLGLTDTIIKAVDNQIADLAAHSRAQSHEVRVSVYTFNDTVQCLVWDCDVLRLPSIRGHYSPNGNTALIDGALTAIAELKEIPQRHGNHAFLIWLLSDGRNNRGAERAGLLTSTIKALPEHWTFGAMIPKDDQTALFEAKAAGIPAGSIGAWSTTRAGAEDMGETMQKTTQSFMRARATGVRGTKTLFSLDTSKISTTAVKSNLSELSPADYMLLPISRKVAIKDFVESWTKETYRPGCAFYNLSKPEKVQAGKQVCIQHKLNGKVYSGANARKMLGLPDHEVKVEPAAHPDFSLFVQSQSVNRWLVPGTNLLVMK